MIHAGAASVRAQERTVRFILAVAGVAAMIWAAIAFPTLSSEIAIADVARAIAAGEVFKADVLQAVDQRIEQRIGSALRSSVVGKAAVIRLRLAEDAIHTRDTKRIDRRIEVLASTIEASLQNAPSDPFLWLARFWLRNFSSGLRPEHMRDLRMSYDIGRYEGWISIKRNGLALAYFAVMPDDLAEMAAAEFVGLVRWGFVNEAAEVSAGAGRQLRRVLFPRLKDLSVDRRLSFAKAVYGRDLDDVLVPGIAPPKPQVPMPALPPGY